MLVRILAPIILLITSSCGTIGYYSQAVGGQMEILRKQKPIEKVVADPETKEKLKERLLLVTDIREFALTRLDLPGGKTHYTSYADLGRPYVLWNVFAAPEFSFKPKTWWYPVVGNLSYRGFFKKEEAKEFLDKLKAEGWDTMAGGVTAYSTLGYFRDPVLNTFIGNSETQLAALLFHELTHHRFFLKGDTKFSECLATAVEQEGLKLWVKHRGSDKLRREFELFYKKRGDFVALVSKTRNQLNELYESSPKDTDEQKAHLRKEKQRIIEEMKKRYEVIKETRWGGDTGYDKWISRDLNNAHFNTVATYYDLVPGFKKLIRESDHDFDVFFEKVEELAELPLEERNARLGLKSEKEETASDG